MKLAATVLCVLILKLNAFGQVKPGGTIIIINASQQEVVIAADSRTSGAHSYSDGNCKISTFGNKVIVSISGRSGERHVSDSRFWDAFTIAREQFKRITLKGAAKNLPLDLAKAWGVAIKKEIGKMLSRDHTLLSGLDHNAIMSAVFAGFVNTRRVVVTEAVTYEDRGNLPPRIIVSEPHVLAEDEFPHWMGRHEIIDQLDGHNAWSNQVIAIMKISPDPIAAEAIEKVRLTIDHLPPTRVTDAGVPFSEVGYPISAIRLTSSGAEWIQQGNCPQD
jgi:hypothetical protein